MTSLKSGLKEMTLLMSGDTVLLIILGVVLSKVVTHSKDNCCMICTAAV
jgi:hypothetical protein